MDLSHRTAQVDDPRVDSRFPSQASEAFRILLGKEVGLPKVPFDSQPLVLMDAQVIEGA